MTAVGRPLESARPLVRPAKGLGVAAQSEVLADLTRFTATSLSVRTQVL